MQEQTRLFLTQLWTKFYAVKDSGKVFFEKFSYILFSIIFFIFQFAVSYNNIYQKKYCLCNNGNTSLGENKTINYIVELIDGLYHCTKNEVFH